MKFSEFDRKERERLLEETEAVASSMGMETHYGYSRGKAKSDNHSRLKNMIGICCDCKNLEYCKTEYGNVYANCEYFEIRITGKERIKECSHYSQRGQMTLNEAFAIAHIIDLGGKKVGLL